MRHYNFEWNGIIMYWYYLSYRSAWLQEHENASLPVIRRRMEFVTGLIFKAETASEYFQVVLFFSVKVRSIEKREEKRDSSLDC